MKTKKEIKKMTVEVQTNCKCCEESLLESSHGGYYCNNEKCPLYGKINPVIWHDTYKKIIEFKIKKDEEK